MTIVSIVEERATVVKELERTTIQKLNQYGIDRYKQHNPVFHLWMCFSDVYRKMLRLERLTVHAADGSETAMKKLIDDYKDIANYAIMAVQILEKQNGVRTDSSS